MAKRPSPTALASLFDAASQLEPAVPLELLMAWSASDQSEATAEALMADYRVEGTCMLGDASGLSRLSRELPLAEVLAMLHKPKSMVMAAGLEAGGEAINGWTADNTALWFPAHVSPNIVARCAADLIASFQPLPFQMSFGLHYGAFYKVGNVLLGPAFQTLEHIAENEVPAGKIWASTDFCGQTGAAYPVAHEGHGLCMHDIHSAGEASRCFADCRVAYPHAFDGTFFRLLDMYARASLEEMPVLRESLEAHASREGFVLFFAYRLSDTSGLVGVLSQQLEDTMLRSRFAEMPMPPGAGWIKAGGGIGIVQGESLEALLDAAKQIGTLCAELEVEVAFGIDHGEYFLFEQHDGDKDVAGSPINIASKLSEDAGEMGSILISEAAWRTNRPAEPRRIQVSGVEITAMQLALASL